MLKKKTVVNGCELHAPIAALKGRCGEREAVEQTGHEPARFFCCSHARCFKQTNEASARKRVEPLDNSFHTDSLEWLPEATNLYFNGEQVYPRIQIANEHEFSFNKSQNLIINTYMGGGMGRGNEPLLTAERMDVEYVRAFGRY